MLAGNSGFGALDQRLKLRFGGVGRERREADFQAVGGGLDKAEIVGGDGVRGDEVAVPTELRPGDAGGGDGGEDAGVPELEDGIHLPEIDLSHDEPGREGERGHFKREHQAVEDRIARRVELRFPVVPGTLIGDAVRAESRKSLLEGCPGEGSHPGRNPGGPDTLVGEAMACAGEALAEFADGVDEAFVA